MFIIVEKDPQKQNKRGHQKYSNLIKTENRDKNRNAIISQKQNKDEI